VTRSTSSESSALEPLREAPICSLLMLHLTTACIVVQVASHAQKHFLRTSGVCKRRSRFAQLEQAVSSIDFATLAAVSCMKKRSASVVPHDSEACKVTEQFAATQASAQGLLGPDVQNLTAMSSALPVYYGMPTFGASSSEKQSLDNSTASDPSGAGRPLLCPLDSEVLAFTSHCALACAFPAGLVHSCVSSPYGGKRCRCVKLMVCGHSAGHPGEQQGGSISCPECYPAPFPKICRPVPYHASARLTDMAKLRADLAAAAADSTLQPLQPSSRSAFFPVHPNPAISA
jgi:hypothetical protein